MGGQHLNKPVIGIAPDDATGGYWEVATDGGIFAFGAPFFGSTGAIHLNKPVVTHGHSGHLIYVFRGYFLRHSQISKSAVSQSRLQAGSPSLSPDATAKLVSITVWAWPIPMSHR